MRALILGILLLAPLSPGCGGRTFAVRRVSDTKRFEEEDRSALDSNRLSERTARFLELEGLAKRASAAPEETVVELHRRLIRSRDRMLAFHLAEICYLDGRRAVRGSGEELARFVSAAEYAYAYLFDARLSGKANPFAAPFRWAVDIHNHALGRIAASAHRGGFGPDADVFTLPALVGDLEVHRGRKDFLWDLEDAGRLQDTFELEVSGLSRTTRSDGIGAPLMAERTGGPRGNKAAADRFLPPMTLSYAVTLLLTFEGSIVDLPMRSRRRVAHLEMLDPLVRDSIRIGDKEVPLEIDLTAPLVHTLQHAPHYSGIKAMLRVEASSNKANLYMFQPYRPGKIPVVFVHGLMSSPQTWMPLFNDLLADPVLRERYQFWFFIYPTGNPTLYSAAVLRGALTRVREIVDPLGVDRGFNRMVVCGHSMGGLLTRRLIDSSGDRLWSAVSTRPLDEMKLSPDQRQILQQMFFFEALPFVKRVIFLATPHRGSKIAANLPGKIGAALIKLPEPIVDAARSAVEQSGLDWSDTDVKTALTGVAGLSPQNRILREIASWPLPRTVKAHSIIANKEGTDPGGTDGLVEYWSSHLEGVASEKIVQSGHSVQETTEAIQEVRRILHLHLRE